VSRALILITLLAAILGTGILAFFMLGGRGGARTGHKQEAYEERIEERRRVPGEAPEAEEEAVTPAGLTRVEVRVGDTSGNAIEGALVRGRGAEARTGVDGRALLSLPRHATSLDAIAEGFLPDTRSGPLPESGVVEFRLEPAAVLTGLVRDRDGSPVQFAQVYLISPEHVLLDRPESWQQTHSGLDGRYLFPGVVRGTWDLGVRKWGYLPAIVKDIEIETLGRIERDIRLASGRSLRGVVKNAGESTRVYAGDVRLRDMLLPPGGIDALADAKVGRGLAGFPVAHDERAVEGIFEIEGLPPGPVDVRATDPSRITEPGLGNLQDVTASSVELTLLDARLLILFVFDATTRKPIEYRLHYRVDGTDDLFPVAVREGSSTPVPADQHRRRLVFSAEGYQTREVVALESHEGVLEVEMIPDAEGETGSFLVLIEPELKPLGRVALVGRDAEGEQKWVKHVSAPDAEGRWRVEGVPVGTYDVTVLATKRVPGLIERVVVSRNLEQTHRVVLSEGAGMALRVTNTKGELLDQVHIWLKDASERRIDLHILSEVSEGRGFVSVNYLPSAATASSDSGLAPGLYTVTAFREGYEVATEEFVVRDGDENAVTVTLRPR
jgi:hypothetical protein